MHSASVHTERMNEINENALRVIEELRSPMDTREYRDVLGLSQAQFAKMAGCDQAVIARAETGVKELAPHYCLHARIATWLLFPDQVKGPV